MRIIKAGNLYDIEKFKEIEVPFDIYFKDKKLFTITDKKQTEYFKRHIKALNGYFHIVFHCIKHKDVLYFYHEETDTLYKDEKEAMEFVKNVYHIITKGRLEKWQQS